MTNLTTDEMKEILWDDHDDYKHVTSPEIHGETRWSKLYSQIFNRVSDNTFWEFNWSRGATEYQDEGPEDIEVSQVYPKQVTTTQYVRNPNE